MKKKKFVAILAISGIILSLLAFLFCKHSFKCGYSQRDDDIKKYS